MSYFVKREHLIGDKPVPYELPCAVIRANPNLSEVEVVTPSGMRKKMIVDSDQVYFKLEAV